MVLGTGRSGGGALSPLRTPLMLPRVRCVPGWATCRGPAEPTHHQGESPPPTQALKEAPEGYQSVWQSSPPQKAARDLKTLPHFHKGNAIPNRPHSPKGGPGTGRAIPHPKGTQVSLKGPSTPEGDLQSPPLPEQNQGVTDILPFPQKGTRPSHRPGEHPTKEDPGLQQTPFPKRAHGHRQSLLHPARAPWISQSVPSLPKRARRAPPPPKGNPGSAQPLHPVGNDTQASRRPPATPKGAQAPANPSNAPKSAPQSPQHPQRCTTAPDPDPAHPRGARRSRAPGGVAQRGVAKRGWAWRCVPAGERSGGRARRTARREV